jgi:hypothetical protein
MRSNGMMKEIESRMLSLDGCFWCKLKVLGSLFLTDLLGGGRVIMPIRGNEMNLTFHLST